MRIVTRAWERELDPLSDRLAVLLSRPERRRRAHVNQKGLLGVIERKRRLAPR
ncbi:hypothetical protein [Caballeronia mineralivorans]|jgi:hypothetical protein|uniref:hypothetical protein n=1 Tax=Caballeronia mineralivorans TaxID=2010198 RepID=UPI0023F1296C|nr:hypothetical protein [Caballeronia mineralivorans]